MDTAVTKPDISTLRVNGQRLWDSLMELAQIGATEKGGVCRLTLTDLDKQGRDLVTRWAREAGMTVTIDQNRQRLHAPCWPQQQPAAHHDRQPHRHPAHRRQV